MSSEAVERRVRAVAGHVLGRALQDARDQPLAQYGMDSALAVEFILRLEEEFGVEFSDEDLQLENFISVGSVLNLLGGQRCDWGKS